MKIRLQSGYRGRPSGEQYIVPGEYDGADPALFGLADYLVETGHAVVTEHDPEPLPAAEDDTAPAGAPLEDMTVAQLKTLADGLGVDLGGARSKADIIDRLRESGAALPEPEVQP